MQEPISAFFITKDLSLASDLTACNSSLVRLEYGWLPLGIEKFVLDLIEKNCQLGWAEGGLHYDLSEKVSLLLKLSLREKCSYSELFWSVVSRIRTEYGEILTLLDAFCNKLLSQFVIK